MCAYETTAESKSARSLSAVSSSEFRIVKPQSDDGTPLMIETLAECIVGVIPTSKGGTGLSELEGNKLIASSKDGNFLEEIEVPINHLSGLKENIQSKLDSIRSYTLPITADSSLWNSTVSDDGTTTYFKEFPLEGIKSTDNPIIGLKLSSNTKEGIAKEQYAYSCMSLVNTEDDKLIVYCFDEIPTVDITICLTCV